MTNHTDLFKAMAQDFANNNCEDEFGMPNEKKRQYLFSQKLIELVVQECSSIAWFAERYQVGNGVPASQQILEKFGVQK